MIDLPTLSKTEDTLLIMEVTKTEVFNTLKYLYANKSSSLNDFNFEFYCVFYLNLEINYFCQLKTFFYFSYIPKACGKTQVTIILRRDKPKSVKHYRSISLCNVYYAVISKLFSNRHKTVLCMTKLVSRVRAILFLISLIHG